MCLSFKNEKKKQMLDIDQMQNNEKTWKKKRSTKYPNDNEWMNDDDEWINQMKEISMSLFWFRSIVVDIVGKKENKTKQIGNIISVKIVLIFLFVLRK